MTEQLISVAKAAGKIGVNRSSLSRQVKAGLIRNYDGLVRLSEVVADRANNIDHAMRRHSSDVGKAASDEGAAQLDATFGATTDATPEFDATTAKKLSKELDKVLIAGEALPLSKAKALKETYLAWLRKLDFEERSGRLVDRDAVADEVQMLARIDRDGLANWPARNAPMMASDLGIDQVHLTIVLEKYIRTHLEQTSTPDFYRESLLKSEKQK